MTTLLLIELSGDDNLSWAFNIYRFITACEFYILMFYSKRTLFIVRSWSNTSSFPNASIYFMFISATLFTCPSKHFSSSSFLRCVQESSLIFFRHKTWIYIQKYVHRKYTPNGFLYNPKHNSRSLCTQLH